MAWKSTECTGTGTMRGVCPLIAWAFSVSFGPLGVVSLTVSEAPSRQTSSMEFPTTHWSQVLVAGDRDAPEARAALGEFCAAYWYPTYAFIRRRGHDADAAADLTQGFFTLLIERRILAVADPARGRLRAFLLTACRNFLTDQYRRDHAQVREGQRGIFSLDGRDAEGRYRAEPIDTRAMTPEQLYDRAWVIAVLERTLDRLRQKYGATGQSELLERLMPALAGDPEAPSAAAIAAELGMTEGAVHVASHRLRQRYRDLVHQEVAALCDPAEVEDEIKTLFAALARPG
jgi:DNA-directed RNA polymerase specialized sigma24 family protein